MKRETLKKAGLGNYPGDRGKKGRILRKSSLLRRFDMRD
jgi:hypothetical protein